MNTDIFNDEKVPEETINALLDELADELFKSWFVDFELFADEEFYEDEFGRRPKGWTYQRIGDIIDRYNEKVKDRTDVRFLSPSARGKLVTRKSRSKSLCKYVFVRPQAFVFNPTRIVCGAIGENDFDFDGCAYPRCVVFETNSCYRNYLKLYFRSKAFKDEVASRAVGEVRKTLNYKNFSQIPVLVPPRSVLSLFDIMYDALFSDE